MCWAYRAAGCVGAYWDELIEAEHPSRDARERRMRRRAAVRLGLGLQEVNLLRDAHEDQRRGRRLLAGLALDGSTPEAERAWFARARADLGAGFAYAASIRSLARRDRLAIALPARLGSRTLELIERERTAWLAGARLKVSRRSVRQELGRAALDALFPSRLARTAGSTPRGGA
jgi:farnesyl-diphosphate farnesyltransferase